MATSLSAWLMGWTPWLPFLLGVAVELCGLLAAFTVPETQRKSTALSEDGTEDNTDDDDDDDADENSQSASHRVKVRLGHVWRQITHHSRFILGNRNIVCISIASLTTAVGPQSVQIMLQYVSKRFAWSMAKVRPRNPRPQNPPHLYSTPSTNIPTGVSKLAS